MTHDLKTGGDRGYLRIATEEAFATREQIDAYLRTVRDGSGAWVPEGDWVCAACASQRGSTGTRKTSVSV